VDVGAGDGVAVAVGAGVDVAVAVAVTRNVLAAWAALEITAVTVWLPAAAFGTVKLTAT
jgi:hypothetical protein